MREILREIGLISRCFESIANIEFKNYQLAKNQYIYLVRICENPGVILERVCDMLKADRSTASRAVEKLRRAGFVQKLDENESGKKIKLYPTAKGLKVFEMLRNDETYSNHIALNGFTEDELGTLHAFLVRIRKNVEPDWETVKKGGSRLYRKIDPRQLEAPEERDDGQAFRISALQPGQTDRVREISYEWLHANDCLEQEDIRILSDPLSYISCQGGEFYAGLLGETVVGCVALIRLDSACYEIAKLGVDKAYRGKGYGLRLLTYAIQRAHALGASKVILYTKGTLKSALTLYRKIGFIPVPLDNGKHEKADVKMELHLEAGESRIGRLGLI